MEMNFFFISQLRIFGDEIFTIYCQAVQFEIFVILRPIGSC